MSRVDTATGLNEAGALDDAWRRSTFVPPAPLADSPAKTRGLRAAVATGVSSVRSLLSRGPNEGEQQRAAAPEAEADPATTAQTIANAARWQDRRFRAGEEGRDTPFDPTPCSPTWQEVIYHFCMRSRLARVLRGISISVCFVRSHVAAADSARCVEATSYAT